MSARNRRRERTECAQHENRRCADQPGAGTEVLAVLDELGSRKRQFGSHECGRFFRKRS